MTGWIVGGALFLALGPCLFWLIVRHGCRIGVHDWRNGPGSPCVLCGAPDDFWE